MEKEIIFAIVSMIFLGLSNSFAKRPSLELGSKRTAFYTRIISSGLLILVAIFFVSRAELTLKAILISLALGIYGYLPLLFFYKAIKIGRVGIATPIAGTSVIYTVILAVVFLSEKISFLQGLSVLVIVAGVFLLTFKIGKLESKKVIIYSIIASVLWGTVSFFMKITADYAGFLIAAAMLEFGVLIGAIIHLKGNIKADKLKANFKNVFFIGSVVAISTFATMKAYSIGDASIISAIVGAYPLISTLHSQISLGEKISLKEWGIILIIIIGVIGVSI